MKRLVASAGLVALSASSLHALYAPELSRIETGKPWTVSASLRGFYDDNWATFPDISTAPDKATWGFEARPYLGFNFPMEQTFVGISYLNSSRFYEVRNKPGVDPWDFTHEATLRFDHAFSPRYQLKVRDVFTYGQEPDTSGIISAPRRADASYVHNSANINFLGQFTERIGGSISYNNQLWDYHSTGRASYSALLDRVEHQIPVDIRWQVKPELVALLGYTFNMVNYTGDDFLELAPGTFRSSDRDSLGHLFWVGADYDVTAQLRAGARVGAQYTTYEQASSEDQMTPYVDMHATYTYAVGSTAELGFRHTISATDIAAADAGNNHPTLDQEASAVYLNLNHQFTPKLSANVMVQYQFSTLHSGLANDVNENILLLGLFLDYKLNQHLAVEAGYNYDWLGSDWRVGGVDPRSYDRNRVFLGIRATY
ncbi:MAG: outer membrane beta-barrel protein [Verrucomicrobia bacterium]|nr:outer membrane beta-barrel protein [Verrucomicrobiota bacterium]